ncbi:MAG TPA: plastocyanin/azurin family copper-binding protein [Solirubrobacterales bacterium]|nr:plastocyanin/azurin family copper-binding protein [Solirubrobacterales bacterium]
MKKFAAMFAVLVAALALVACGGGDDTTSDTAAETPTTQEENGGGGEKEAEGGTAGSATVDFEADPSGALAYTTDSATAKAGEVTVNFTNSSSVPHDVAIEDEAGETIAETEVLAEGSDSTTAELEPGEYKFYCSVPGHRQGGMEGTLTVK